MSYYCYQESLCSVYIQKLSQMNNIMHLPLLFTATYDVQRVNASGSSTITVIVELMSNATAKGVFIVLWSEDGSPDELRALLRPDNHSTSVNYTIDNVPPSTYTVSAYDLEQDGLPNADPACEQSTTVSVTMKGRF